MRAFVGSINFSLITYRGRLFLLIKTQINHKIVFAESIQKVSSTLSKIASMIMKARLLYVVLHCGLNLSQEFFLLKVHAEIF